MHSTNTNIQHGLIFENTTSEQPISLADVTLLPLEVKNMVYNYITHAPNLECCSYCGQLVEVTAIFEAARLLHIDSMTIEETTFGIDSSFCRNCYYKLYKQHHPNIYILALSAIKTTPYTKDRRI